MRTLNLGILAHVDAGKTTLTEQLLFAAGVIDKVGSVDAGNTQTDTLALERQRGITIKSAVVAFEINGVSINLIDTPGHPDFIAEVERVLNVLDGVVLVISAVEGVQAQTRILMRTLQRLRIPTLIFVNKIDRRGAQDESVLRSVANRLNPAIIAMGSPQGLGTHNPSFVPYDAADSAFTARLTQVVADRDDTLLAAFLDDTPIPYDRLRRALIAQTQRAQLHPVYFGSAVTGAGLAPLVSAITEFLPATEGDGEGPVSGVAFKVDRGPIGEKIAYVRMFSGTIHARDRLPLGESAEGKVTAIEVFDSGRTVRRDSVSAGHIAKLCGLAEVQVGDGIGIRRTTTAHHFATPTLETVVVPRSATDKGAIHTALTQLDEQDPLINLRQDDVRGELYVSLYGEVQKEVIQATLAIEFGLDVTFRGTTPICIERPTGTGAALELLGKGENPYIATVGVRIEPAPIGAGVEFRAEVAIDGIPIHIYKDATAFRAAIEKAARRTLRQGLYGWEVTDCVVTMTRSEFTPATSPKAFRLLTPLVTMAALKQAGTVVCEPIHRFRLEVPADTLGRLMPALARLRAVPETPSIRKADCSLEGALPAARVHRLRQQLSGLTRGEGVMESSLDHYQPVTGAFPTRPRTDENPLDRKEYLRNVKRGG